MWRTAAQLCGVAVLSISSAFANEPISLFGAWEAARTYDPGYQAAISERDAGEMERAIGRAGLLPQVSGAIGRTRMDGHIKSPDARGNMQRQDLDYTAKTNELSAQQMLFDWSAITTYRQGHAKADLALATFDTKANENSERLINRYFQLLLTHQQMVIAKNNVDATAKHVQIAEHHFTSGEGTITAIHEAQARYDMAVARYVISQDNVVIARRELQEMIGSDPQQIYGLQAELSDDRIQPDYLDGWMDLAMQRNAQIRAANQDLRVSGLEIQRVFSGHLPSVHAIGRLSKTENETISTRDQKSSTRSIGVQINVPVYSGGRTQAQVQQAQHNRDRSQYEMDAVREEIAVEVTRQFQGVVSGAQHIQALQKAVESSHLAVTAAEQGYRGGIRSIRDILDSQDRLFEAELELTKARLDYVLARLMLAAVSDGLDGTIIQQTTAQFFSTTPTVLNQQ